MRGLCSPRNRAHEWELSRAAEPDLYFALKKERGEVTMRERFAHFLVENGFARQNGVRIIVTKGYWNDAGNRDYWRRLLAEHLGKGIHELTESDFRSNGLGGLWEAIVKRAFFRIKPAIDKHMRGQL